MKRPKILFLSPYPEHIAPSQRLKYEQYFEMLNKEGYEIETNSFVSASFWKILYQEGHFVAKFFFILLGYDRRFFDVLRLHKYDVVYVHLWVTPIDPPLFEKLVRWRAKHLVYDIDDMVFLGHHSVANKNFSFLKGSGKMIHLMKHSDHVITCTPLLDQFTRKFNINTSDISSTVDTEEKYQVVNQYTSDSKVVLGWSGSHSTSKYLYLLKGVLIDLAKEYDFRLLVIGGVSFDLKGVNFEALAWSEEIEMSTLKQFDIGLYPLPNEKWMYGKSA
tara:strand:+ start:368 stop:1192 length:825 start_codon:yes stop_codon:yes gene_type:complete